MRIQESRTGHASAGQTPKTPRPAPISIRLEPHLVKALREICTQEERSLNFIIRRAIKAHLTLHKRGI